MAKLIIHEPSHTLQEYLLQPGLTRIGLDEASVSLKTPLSRFRRGEEPSFTLNAPFLSAIMQSVTGPALAIELARQGGLGFIYGSQPIESQAAMVDEVKERKSGFVRSKANLPPDATLEHAIRLMEQTGYSTIPVTEGGSPDGKLHGILTDADFWRYKDPADGLVSEYMTPFESLKVGPKGMSLSDANEMMRVERRKNLPIVDNDGNLVAIVFKKDYYEHKMFPGQLVDSQKRLMVGAGLNTRDYERRAPALIEAGADALCFDSSDGHSEYQARAARHVRELIEEHHGRTGKRIVLGGGNIVTGEAFWYLANAGLDFVKVGIGGGSICITREQKGIGLGQGSAVEDVAKARDEYFKLHDSYLPIISDGGIVFDPQITVALALGADAVMLGRYFARFEEAPGAKVIIDGSLKKEYWGEGSSRAKNWQRYGDSGATGLKFEEGVDGYVPFAGPLAPGVGETFSKVRSAFVNAGASSVRELNEQAVLRTVSQATMVEGGAHDIVTPLQVIRYSQMKWG